MLGFGAVSASIAVYESGNFVLSLILPAFYLFLASIPLREMWNKRHKTTKTFLQNNDDFTSAFLALAAAIIQADEKVKEDELNYVYKFLYGQFSEKNTDLFMKRLRTDYLNKTIDHKKVARYFSEQFEKAEDRSQLLYVLTGIATIDWLLHKNELTVLQEIADSLQLSPATVNSLLAMFRYSKQWREKRAWDDNAEGESWRFGQQDHEQSQQAPRSSFTLDISYQILELDASASDSQVKKSYRKLAVKYHPDKVVHLGEAYQKTATEKFQKIAEAYSIIKKSRGMK